MDARAHGHAGTPAGVQTYMCTSCDKACVKEGFPSVYSLAQADLAQLVEHNLAKVGVAGSSPVVRSSESSSAVSPGETALFVVVVTRDQAITRRATPQTSTRSMGPAPSPSRVHARTHPQHAHEKARAAKLARQAGRPGYADAMSIPAGVLGNPWCFAVTSSP